MERLNKAFKRLDWNTAIIKQDYEHADIVATVWAEYTGHMKPKNICLGTLRNFLRSTYNAWVNYNKGLPTVGWNYIPKEQKKKVVKQKEIVKPIVKKTKKNKKKGKKK